MVLKFSQGNDIPLSISITHGAAAVAGLAVLFVVVSPLAMAAAWPQRWL